MNLIVFLLWGLFPPLEKTIWTQKSWILPLVLSKEESAISALKTKFAL